MCINYLTIINIKSEFLEVCVKQERTDTVEMLTDMTPAAAGQLYPQLQSISKSPAHHMVSVNTDKSCDKSKNLVWSR